jgi:hypothetical protein
MGEEIIDDAEVFEQLRITFDAEKDSAPQFLKVIAQFLDVSNDERARIREIIIVVERKL